MTSGNEGVEPILNAKGFLKHCHVAASETRTHIGLDSTDFEPIFSAFRKIGYDGGISCKYIWGNKEDLEKNLTTALVMMKKFGEI